MLGPWPQESGPAVLAGAAVLGYLLGSIPFGLILTRLAGMGDIRDVGSGNIGATNVLRTGNRWVALLTLLGDGAKGAVAVSIARNWGTDAALIAALSAFLGHLYPVWIGFRGGKGVATFLGLQLALFWPVGLLCCAAWLLGAAVTRISSMGALTAAVAAPAAFAYLHHPWLCALGIILTLFIWWRHRDNIRRILQGTEPRIGQSERKPNAVTTSGEP